MKRIREQKVVIQWGEGLIIQEREGRTDNIGDRGENYWNNVLEETKGCGT